MGTLKRILILVTVLSFMLVACQSGQGDSGDGTASSELPTPAISTDSTPNVEMAASAYLDAWDASDYAAMYDLLTTISQGAISFEDFEARYADVDREANLFRVEHSLLQSLTNPASAQVAYRLVLHSAVIGPITRETQMSLSLENDEWRIAWADELILPELAGGNTLSMERFDPARGNIYDNAGSPIAVNTTAYAIGVIPSAVLDEEAGLLISSLSNLTGVPINNLNEAIFPEEGEAPFYISVGEVPADVFEPRIDNYSGFSGIRYEAYDTRLYYSSGIAPQSVGYVGAIPAEEVDQYVPLGYRIDDTIGRLGVESWAEEYLSGTRGGALYVISPEGQIVTQLAQSQPEAAASVFTTIDADLQVAAQEAIKDFSGAIVVLERDTGRVLAMVSAPDFNPNWADINNYNSGWGSYFPDEGQRFFNRATQGQYEPGSIFKVISMAAAMETGIYSANSTLNCGYEWTGLEGFTLYDWTLEKDRPESGNLNLMEGLMRSCNPWFYEIGLQLYDNGFTDAVAEMARAFGLGTSTGLATLPEAEGQVLTPNEDPAIGRGEAVQQGIGHGSTTITPLQAAVFTAALGNGGTLYTPYIVDRVETPAGAAILDFTPQAVGTLPMSENTAAAVQTAMRSVITDPRGTAYSRFLGFTVPVFGKTGTPSIAGEDPHAWFIGYTDLNSPSNPDIAIAVLVENIGDGSEFAAPIFRRVASEYFFNTPGPLYPWENDYGVLDLSYFEDIPVDENGNPIIEDASGGNDGVIEVSPVN